MPFTTFDGGDGSKSVLDQLYQAYAESHESDPPEIWDGFKKLEEFLHALPLSDNNAVCNLCCHLCAAYERKAFLDDVQYGAHLMQELINEMLCLHAHCLQAQYYDLRNIFSNKIFTNIFCYALGSPYSLRIAVIETTHCLPNLHTSTPSTNLP